MYSRSSNTLPSSSSIFDKFKVEIADASLFSEDSPLLAGLNWELNDLLSKDDNVGSDCLEVLGGPEKTAG